MTLAQAYSSLIAPNGLELPALDCQAAGQGARAALQARLLFYDL
jgi:hypothetical protein